MANTVENLEHLLAQIGNANRFQVIMVFFIKAPAALISWTMVEMAFVKAQPDWCCVPDDITESPEEYCYSVNGSFGDTCPGDNANCSTRLFDPNLNTAVNQWDLVCDNKWKVDLSISVQMAGVLVGAIGTGSVADFLGRKKTFFISIFTLMIVSLVTGFSSSWEMFMVCRLLLGISCGVYLVVCIPYMIEFLSPSWRHIPSVLPVYALGSIIMTLIAWQLQDWRWVHWIRAAILLPFIPSWFFLPESLRWLTVKGRLDEAEQIVTYIAGINRKPVPSTCRNVLEIVFEQERKDKEEGAKTYTYIDIYRGWPVFKLSMIFQIMWFAFSFCGYGISFGASTLGLNLYLNLFLVPLTTLPSLLVMQVLTENFRVGRRTIAMLLLFCASLCGFASIAVYQTVSDKNDNRVITSILCLAANGCLGGAWAVVVVLNNESYPTVLRSLSYAAANTISRLGGILAPFAFDFKKMPLLAYASIAGFMGLSTILLFFLDETLGQNLHDTMQEAKLNRDPANDSAVSQPLIKTSRESGRTEDGIDEIASA